MTVTELITLLTGVYVRVTADGVDTPQCVDLAQVFNRIIGGPRFTGDAHTIFNQAGTTYTQIPNTPDGVPQAGDIVVWSPAYNGGPGHVGIATGKGDTNSFEAFAQNDPLGSDCELKTYAYVDVMGWLRPINLPQDQQTIIDQLRKERDDNWNVYQAELIKEQDLQKQLTDCQNSKVVVPTPTNITIPVTTTGDPVVATSTPTPISANYSDQKEIPSQQVKPLPMPTPTKPSMSLWSSIVFFFTNIFNTRK